MSSAPDPRVVDPVRPDEDYAFYPNGAPAPADWTERAAELTRAVASLEQAIRAPRREQKISGVAQDSTNADGDVVFPVYQCFQGFYFDLHRVCVESSGHTPAAPYVDADSWLGFYISTDPTSVAQGQLVDFAPTTDGAQMLPVTADYAEKAGPLLRSGEYLVLKIVAGSGLASTRITVRFQGVLTGVET